MSQIRARKSVLPGQIQAFASLHVNPNLSRPHLGPRSLWSGDKHKATTGHPRRCCCSEPVAHKQIQETHNWIGVR
jgi:hypothetical protein